MNDRKKKKALAKKLNKKAEDKKRVSDDYMKNLSSENSGQDMKKTRKNEDDDNHETNKINKRSFYIAIIEIVFTAVSIFIAVKALNGTEVMNGFNMDNADLNYTLELSEKENCKNILMKSSDAVFSVGPFAFNVIRNQKSGLYSERYFIHMEKDDISSKKIEDNMVMFVDMEPTSIEELLYGEGKETSESKCPVADEDMIAIYYSNPNELYDPYGLFHIVFRGYNNSYQYFTIIAYNPTVVHKEKINGYTASFVNYNVSIIEDNDLNDRHTIQDIVHKINSKEVQNADDLRNKIEYERNIIKEKIK